MKLGYGGENQEQGLLSEAWFVAERNLELERPGDAATRKDRDILQRCV